MVEVLAVLCVFGIPLSWIWTSHRHKMLELQLRLRNEGSSSVHAEVEAMRQEIRSLRETTMQYDLSFDTALQRMEQRMESMERRVNGIEASNVAELRSGR